MLRNPVHLRLKKLASWQHITFMACLCERMYPNYWFFCQQTHADGWRLYRNILDLVWEYLLVKDAHINFENQLKKLEEIIPSAGDVELYAVYPAIDACAALSELVHSFLDNKTLEYATEVSKFSITTVAMLEMSHAGHEMTEEALNDNPAVIDEWDSQWEIYRLLAEYEESDPELIKSLREELRNTTNSNIGIKIDQQSDKT